MKKIYYLFALFLGIVCFGFVGCGDPYANMEIDISTQEVVLYMNPSEEDQSKTAEVEVTVKGIDTNVINQEVAVKYLTTENVVTASSIKFDKNSGKSTITLQALSKGNANLVFVSKDNDKVVSKTLVVRVVNLVESFNIKSNANISLATGESLDLSKLDIFNFSNDTDQTEMDFSILKADDSRYDQTYLSVTGVNLTQDGVLSADEECLGGIVQIAATSKYIGANPSAEKYANLSKVFKVMVYKNFEPSDIEIFMSNDITTPIDVSKGLLLTRNVPSLNPQTIIAKVRGDVVTNFSYSVTSNKNYITITPGISNGLETFMVKAEDSGNAVLTINAAVIDSATNTEYARKSTTLEVSCIRVVKEITLSAEEVTPVTNGTIEVDVYQTSEYDTAVLGTGVGITLTPKEVENRSYVLRIVSTDGNAVTDQNRNDIVVKTAVVGNTNGKVVAFGDEIKDANIFISYFNSGLFTSNFVLAVVANSFDERLTEVVAYIKCNIQMAVGDIVISDSIDTMLCVGDEVNFSFRANGESSRFALTFSTPGVLSITEVNDQRNYKITAIKEGETILTVRAKGTGNYKTVNYKVLIVLESASLSVPNHNEVVKITQHVYGEETVDDEGLVDKKPLQEVAVQTSSVFKVSTILEPSNATVESITFECSNPGFVSIDSSGRVVAYGMPCSATITVTFVYQVRETAVDGSHTWSEKTSVRSFRLTVYKPITSVVWFGGTNRAYVEVWDYNSLSKTNQADGKASASLHAVVYPSTATAKEFQWRLADDADAEYLTVTPTSIGIDVTGHLPLSYEGDEREVTVNGWVTEYGVEHSIVCVVKIKKPQHLTSVSVSNYDNTQGIYLEGAGRTGVSNANWELGINTFPNEALSHEVSYVLFNAEVSEETSTVIKTKIALSTEQMVTVNDFGDVAIITPKTGKRGYTIMRIIPSSLLNQDRPDDSILQNTESDEYLENAWVNAVINATVYCDVWILVADGSENAPFQILDVQDFCDIEKKGLDKHYVVKRNIDFSGYILNSESNWVSLGGLNEFTGSISSFNYGSSDVVFQLYGLTIDTQNYRSTQWEKARSYVDAQSQYISYIGLFGKNNGTISNLEIIYEKIIVDPSGASSYFSVPEVLMVGAIAGYNGPNGLIKNVSVTIGGSSSTGMFIVGSKSDNRINTATSIESHISYIGGIVGYNDGQTKTCSISAKIIAEIGDDPAAIGGVCGFNRGQVDGGIVAIEEVQDGNGQYNIVEVTYKTNIVVDMQIDGGSSNFDSVEFGIIKYGVGGIVGVMVSDEYENENTNIASISNYDASGNIVAEGFDNVGGIVGATYGDPGAALEISDVANLFSCSASTHVLAASNVGGIAGYNEGASYYKTYYECYQAINVENAYANTSLRGLTNVGGFIGMNVGSGQIQYCYTTSFIPLDFVYESGNPLESNQYKGDIIAVNGVSDAVTGGFIAYQDFKNGTAGQIANCYSKMSIGIDRGTAGGFIGYVDFVNGYIENCYSLSRIICTSNEGGKLGGFIGQVSFRDYGQPFIEHSYAVSGLSYDGNNMDGILFGRYTNGTDVLYNSQFNFVATCGSVTNVEFDQCYYADPNTYDGKHSFGALAVPFSSMKGYHVEVGNRYVNATAPAFGVGSEFEDWFEPGTGWVPYSDRVGLNSDLPTLYLPDGKNVMMNVETTNIQITKIKNYYTENNQLLPVFFKYDNAKVIAVLNSMTTNTYALKDIIELTTSPIVALTSNKIYITTSDSDIVAVSNAGVPTYFNTAKLVFNKPGTVTITIMSATNFDVRVTFQICVIAGFSNYELHQSTWASGEDSRTISIKLGEADILVPYLSNGTRYVDTLYIYYKVAIDGALPDGMTYDRFASFVNYPWQVGENCFYVRIPLTSQTTHLLEGLNSTAMLDGLMLRILTQLQLEVYFYNNLNELETFVITFDETTVKNLFGADEKNKLVIVADDISTLENEAVVENLDTTFRVRVYKGVSGAEINPTSAETETSRVQPVSLTVYTDATDVLLDNLRTYIKAKLEVNGTTVVNSLLGETQILAENYVSNVSPLTAEDLGKLVDEIAYLVSDGVIDFSKIDYHENTGESVIFNFEIGLYEKYLTEEVTLLYTFVIYDDLDNEVNRQEIEIILKPTQISSMEVLHYLDVSDISQGKADSEEISSGQTGLLVVNVYNSYSDFDYITVTSSYNANDMVSFVQVKKTTDVSRFVALDPRSVYIDTYTIKGVKTDDYTGSFYFTTTLGSGIPKGTMYTITIRAYKQTASGDVLVQYSKVKRLAARYVPFMNLSVNSPYGNIVARGTEVTINMSGSVTNSSVLINIPSANSNLGKSSIIPVMGDNYNSATGYEYTPANDYEAENGKQVTGSFKLYVGPEATCTAEGLLVQAVTTTLTSTGGTETVVYNLYLKLVDFIVESLGVTDVSDGVLSPSMENIQDLNLYFNIQPSTLEMFNQYYSTGTDTALDRFLNSSQWGSLNNDLSWLGDATMPGTYKEGTKLADEKGYAFVWTTDGGSVSENAFLNLCDIGLFQNCNLRKITYEGDAVGVVESMITRYADYMIYKSCFKNTSTSKIYDFVYAYAFNNTTVWNRALQAHEILLLAKVVEEADEIIGNVQTSFSNIREAVLANLLDINTFGEGFNAMWYYRDGMMFRPLSSTNNTCPNFDVTFTAGTGYSISGKTLNPTVVEIGLRTYYEYENGVFRFKCEDINSATVDSRENVVLLSTQFTIQFRNTSTLDRPSPIYDEIGLMAMVDGGNYMLMSDITVYDWAPLTQNIASFDGNGHIISICGFSTEALTSSGSVITESNIGFFEKLSEGSIVKNLILDVSRTVYVNARNTKTVNFGFVAGVNEGGIITNCDVITTLNNNWYDETMPVRDTESWLYNANLGLEEMDASAETVFEQIKASLRDDTVVNKPTIASTFLLTSSRVGGEDTVIYTGGIVGKNEGGYITNSRVGRVAEKNIGTSFATSTQGINIFSAGNLGGIAGYNSGVISSSYYANGSLVNTTKTGVEVSVGQTSSSNTTGGLVAYNDSDGKITTSYVIGMENSIDSDTGRAALGGIYSFGTIGGFVNTNKGVIENCYSNISISTQRATGGFVYNNADAKAEIKYSYSMSAVTYYSSNNGPFTGIDKEGQVLNVGLIEYCYYLIDNSYLVNEDEAATGLSGEAPAGKQSEWNDPNGSYFVGYVLTVDPEYETSKKATWIMPDASSNKKGPQLVDANTIAVSSRRATDYLYETGYSLGSDKNPYLISDATQFDQILCNFGTSNNARIVADIDFDGNTPQTTLNSVDLTGTIRGNGMTIKNYSLSLGTDASASSYKSLGIFKSIKAGIVSNLTLEIETEFSSLSATFVGGLAGQIDSSLVENIKISSYENSNAQVKARNVAGGLAGIISGDSQIENIVSSVSVYVDYATIQYENTSHKEAGYDYRYRYFKEVKQDDNSYVYAESSYYSYAGGIAGVVAKANVGTDPTIVNCMVNGNITIRADIVGGVFGVIDKNVVASRLKFVVNGVDSTQKLWAENFAGGLVGENRGKIQQSYVSLSESAQVKDDVALSEDANTSNHIGYLNLFQGETTNAIGGLVGLNRGSVTATRNNGTYSYTYYGIIETSYSRVAVVNKNAQLAGGIIGLAVDSSRIEDPIDASKTSLPRDSKYINVRNIFGITDIIYLTGSNSSSMGVYYGDLNDSNVVKVSGSIDEVWTTGAVKAGGEALANGGGHLFTSCAAGGFVGALVDPMNASNTEKGVTLALINNQVSSVETDISNGYKLGSMAGHVAYTMRFGLDYASPGAQAPVNMFVGALGSNNTFSVPPSGATGVSKVYTNTINSINIVGSLSDTMVANVYRSGENYTLREVATSASKNRDAFAGITSDVWQKDETLETTIFPVIKMGKIVTQIYISTVTEFLNYMQGGVGGKYLLTEDIVITKALWADRTSLTNGGTTPITGSLRGYKGNGNAATITLSGFCEGQLHSFDSLFGLVSGFTLSNINFVFPQGIESVGEAVECTCGASFCQGTRPANRNQYFGLIASQATDHSSFENLSISISGTNKNILVNDKRGVGVFVGKADNSSFTNLRINDNISFINSDYTIRDAQRTSFGGIVGEATGKTDVSVGDFGSIKYQINTARIMIDTAILFVGGLVGSASGTLKVSHSAVTADIDVIAPYAKDVYIGGIVGCASNGGEIAYCSVDAAIKLDKERNSDSECNIFFGGIAGDAQKIEVKGNSVAGTEDWTINTDATNIYAGGIAGRVTSSIVYRTNALTHSGAVLSNDANFNLKIGTNETPLADCNVFFGGIVGQFETVTSDPANQVPVTTIIGQNASLGDVEIHGVYAEGGTETQAYVGGIVGNITNDIVDRVSTPNIYCVVAENIALENIRVFGFFNSYYGGIVGQSYFIIQNCASYGILSYTSTGTGSDNIRMGGIAGVTYCPISSCYTTSSITQYGLDISRDNVKINAIIGKGTTKGTLLTNCYYNFELTGVLDENASATQVEDVKDMMKADKFTFTGATWQSGQVDGSTSFLYPSSMAKYIDFTVGGNMVPVYVNNFAELLSSFENATTKNKIIIVNFEKTAALSQTDMGNKIQNCSRLVGNGAVLDFSQCITTTIEASLGQNIGVFASVDKDIIVSGIYIWFGKLTVKANAASSNPDGQSINIGLFAGQNNGVLIDCVAGYLPKSTLETQSLAQQASRANLDAEKLEVSTLVINMDGVSSSNYANVYVGGLVGQNNGAINMCWAYMDQIINNYTYATQAEANASKYKLYVGGLVGQQSITGSTANTYVMGKINFVSVTGPVSDSGSGYDTELGTFVGGIMGYDLARCLSYSVSIVNFKTINETTFVHREKFSLLLGGIPGGNLITETLFSCDNISTGNAGATLSYNETTSANQLKYKDIKGITPRLNSNWLQDSTLNYGLPFLKIYKGDLSTGQGVADDPYQIAEWQALCEVKENRFNATHYYCLTRDMIAIKSTSLSTFISLDGAGHSIYVYNIQNLAVSGSSGNYALFDTFKKDNQKGSVIQNLFVRYADYTYAGFSGDVRFGGLAIKNEDGCIIQNCAIIGTTTTANAQINFASSKTNNYYGGIVVNNAGLIEKSFTSLNINVQRGIYGGIAGQLTGSGVIQECFTSGGPNFTNSGNYGGIVGRYSKTTDDDGIIDCYVRANAVTIASAAVSSVKVGAFVGLAESSVKIVTSYFYVLQGVISAPNVYYSYGDIGSEERTANGLLIGQQSSVDLIEGNSFRNLYYYDPGSPDKYPAPTHGTVSAFASNSSHAGSGWSSGTTWTTSNFYLVDVTPDWQVGFLAHFSA